MHISNSHLQQAPLQGHVCSKKLRGIENRTLAFVNHWLPKVSSQIEQNLHCLHCALKTQEELRAVVREAANNSNLFLPVIHGQEKQIVLVRSSNRNHYLETGAIVKDSSSPFYFMAPFNETDFQRCVTSSEEAKALFQVVKTSSLESWEFKEEGCASRARVAACLCRSLGIGAKYLHFIYYIAPNLSIFDGKQKIYWKYHVALAVTVMNKGLRVFDPSLKDKPIKTDKWRDLQHQESQIGILPKTRIFRPAASSLKQTFVYNGYDAALVYLPISHRVTNINVACQAFCVMEASDANVVDTLKSVTMYKTKLVFDELPKMTRLVLQDEIEIFETIIHETKKIESFEFIETFASFNRLKASIEYQLPLFLASDVKTLSPRIILQSTFFTQAIDEFLRKYESAFGDGAAGSALINNHRHLLTSARRLGVNKIQLRSEERKDFAAELTVRMSALNSLPYRIGLEREYLIRLDAACKEIGSSIENPSV